MAEAAVKMEIKAKQCKNLTILKNTLEEAEDRKFCEFGGGLKKKDQNICQGRQQNCEECGQNPAGSIGLIGQQRAHR